MTALCLGLVVFFAVVDTPANAQVACGMMVAEPEGLANSQPVPIAALNGSLPSPKARESATL